MVKEGAGQDWPKEGGVSIVHNWTELPRALELEGEFLNLGGSSLLSSSIRSCDQFQRNAFGAQMDYMGSGIGAAYKSGVKVT